MTSILLPSYEKIQPSVIKSPSPLSVMNLYRSIGTISSPFSIISYKQVNDFKTIFQQNIQVKVYI